MSCKTSGILAVCADSTSQDEVLHIAVYVLEHSSIIASLHIDVHFDRMELTVQRTIEVIYHHCGCEVLDVGCEFSRSFPVHQRQVRAEVSHLLAGANLEHSTDSIRDERSHLGSLDRLQTLGLLDGISTIHVAVLSIEQSIRDSLELFLSDITLHTTCSFIDSLGSEHHGEVCCLGLTNLQEDVGELLHQSYLSLVVSGISSLVDSSSELRAQFLREAGSLGRVQRIRYILLQNGIGACHLTTEHVVQGCCSLLRVSVTAVSQADIAEADPVAVVSALVLTYSYGQLAVLAHITQYVVLVTYTAVDHGCNAFLSLHDVTYAVIARLIVHRLTVLIYRKVNGGTCQMAVHAIHSIGYRDRIFDVSHEVVGTSVEGEGAYVVESIAVVARTHSTGNLHLIVSGTKFFHGLAHIKGTGPYLGTGNLLLALESVNLHAHACAVLPTFLTLEEVSIGEQA